jgi:uncharacterized protein
MVVLSVEEIKQKPREVSFSELPSTFMVLHEAEQSGECTFLTPISGTLSAVWEYDHVRVEVGAGSRLRLYCARCLNAFEREIAVSFVIYYSEAAPGAVPDDEVELTEQDLLSASFFGDEIHVSKEIAEQLLMELPVKPLCDERCLGLCLGCGNDLNHEICSCEQQVNSFAFNALKNFTVPRKGD